MSRFAPDLDLQQRLIKRSLIMLTVILVISLLSFAGWMFSVEWLKHPVSGLVAMSPLTSLCFIALVTALRFKLKYKDQKRKQRVAGSITVIVFVITFLKLVAIIAGIDYPLDQLLFVSKANSNTIAGFKGTMSQDTALGFSLLATGMLLLNKPRHIFQVTAQVITVLPLMVAVFSILGYLFGAQEFYEVQNYSAM